MRRIKTRKRSGATVVLPLIIAFFAVLPLSILGFEMSRFFLEQAELQHVLDAAALAGTAALASSQSGQSLSDQHQTAMKTAWTVFTYNSILKTNFSATNVAVTYNTGATSPPPPLYNATLDIALLNQNGGPEATNSANATVMRINGAFTDSPIFVGKLVPIANQFTVRAYANAGLPQLDLALAFDISGSMDDQTPVTFVKRYWDGTNKQVHYAIVGTPGQTIFAATGPQYTGSSLNATKPQNLSYASYPSPSNTTQYTFSDGAYPAGNPMAGLRSLLSAPAGSVCPEQGRPPGNWVKTNPSLTVGNGIDPLSTAVPNGFTDMVAVPAGYTAQSAVEASRGNLNDAATLLASQGGVKVSSELTGYSISPTAYTDYWTAVNNMAAPMNAARTAAVNFFNLMNTSTNGHFMLETFADAPGQSASDVFTAPTTNIDAGYTAGGNGVFPLPFIDLNQSDSQITQVTSAISPTSGTVAPLNATGKTDITGALTKCLASLTDTGKYRPTAKRAIVLFTDGVPNVPDANSAPGNAKSVAQNTAAANGIPIYTIGLSQNPTVLGYENSLLGDTAAENGIAYLSGNKAIYVSVTDPTNLNNAFQTIARSLVVLQ